MNMATVDIHSRGIARIRSFIAALCEFLAGRKPQGSGLYLPLVRIDGRD